VRQLGYDVEKGEQVAAGRTVREGITVVEAVFVEVSSERKCGLSCGRWRLYADSERMCAYLGYTLKGEVIVRSDGAVDDTHGCVDIVGCDISILPGRTRSPGRSLPGWCSQAANSWSL
jgi:hypothetical protein